MMSRLLPFAFILAAIPPAAADEGPPKPLAGQIRLDGGRLVEYETHYNRNAIRAVARLDKGLIVAMLSGVLDRFDSLSGAPARERVDVPGIASLTRGDGESFFAGFDDGRVCRLDTETLELVEIAKLPGEVKWIGWSKAERAGKAGLVAAIWFDEVVEVDGKREEIRRGAIHDLASGKSFTLENRPSSFFVDREGRLWVGADRGEWGGWVVRINLDEGKMANLPPPPSTDADQKASWHAVNGFIELADGQIWAFGGTNHMGITDGEFTRVDLDAPRVVFAYESPELFWGGPQADPNLPEMPPTRVLEEPDGFLVFSYDDVFRVDRAFKTWKRVTTLDLDYEWGRPDAVGAYPAITDVLTPSREGEPHIIATNLNGILLLDGTNLTAMTAPGQLIAPSVSEIRNTTEGLLFLSGDGRAVGWRLGAKGWETVQLAPPYEIDPDGEAAPLENEAEAWASTQVFVKPDGAILTVSGSGEDLGTRTTALRVDGKPEILNRRTSDMEPSACFLAPDGSLWSAGDYLRRFENGRWSMVAHVPEPYVHFRLKAATTGGPPWLFLDREPRGYEAYEYGVLWRLDLGARGDAPKLAMVRGDDPNARLIARDAIPWPGGALLATNKGFQTYDSATGRLAKIDLGAPAETVTAMAHDGLGRLWLGCEDGLRLVDVESAKSEWINQAPGVGDHQVDCLAADPARDDGVVAVVNSEAVVFIRAERKP